MAHSSVRDDAQFKMTAIYGYVKLKQFTKFEGGRLVYYSYSITYNRQGKELSRTEATPLSSIGWDDGSPFTKTDYIKLKG